MTIHRCHTGRRRGGTSIVLLIIVASISLFLLALIQGGSREQLLTVRRVETVRSFYAAEAGMNMAMQEMAVNTDEDSDGVIGSISDDGDDANNPQLSSATVMVSRTDSLPSVMLISKGQSGQSLRRIESELLQH